MVHPQHSKTKNHDKNYGTEGVLTGEGGNCPPPSRLALQGMCPDYNAFNDTRLSPIRDGRLMWRFKTVEVSQACVCLVSYNIITGVMVRHQAAKLKLKMLIPNNLYLTFSFIINLYCSLCASLFNLMYFASLVTKSDLFPQISIILLCNM